MTFPFKASCNSKWMYSVFFLDGRIKDISLWLIRLDLDLLRTLWTSFSYVEILIRFFTYFF